MFPLEVPKQNLIDFHHNDPAIKYVQHDKNIFVFSSLASAMYNARENVAEDTIDSRIKSYFKSESLGYLYRIKFANRIITDCVREEGDQHLCYKMVKI